MGLHAYQLYQPADSLSFVFQGIVRLSYGAILQPSRRLSLYSDDSFFLQQLSVLIRQLVRRSRDQEWHRRESSFSHRDQGKNRPIVSRERDR